MSRPDRFPETGAFAALRRGEPDVDLFEVALELAAEADPGLDPDRYRQRLEMLSDRVRSDLSDGMTGSERLGVLKQVLFLEEGYRGNPSDYYDPRNSYIHHVLDRKLGIPISLSLLTIAVGERAGIPLVGVNTPGHFLVRLDVDGSDRDDRPDPNTLILIDPFHGGEILDRDGCQRRLAEITGQFVALDGELFQACPPQRFVVRMLRNLKAIYFRRRAFEEARTAMRRLVALVSEEPREHRDLGLACLEAQHYGEAISGLEHYLDQMPEAEDRAVIERLLQLARDQQAQWN